MRLLRLVVLVMMVLAVAAPTAPVRAQTAPGPLVQQAFDRLMDEFITPPSSATLLSGGWERGTAFVKAQSGNALEGPAPTFGGDRTADWTTFLSAYPALVAALGTTAELVDLDRAIVMGMAASLSSRGTWLRLPEGPTLQTAQRFGGIGIRTNTERVIIEVYSGSPAESAGVHLGDRIAAVNGQSLDGAASSIMAEQLRGQVGTPVRVSMSRAGVAAPVEFDLTRAEIVVSWIEAQVQDAGVGYLRVRNFPPGDQARLDATVAGLSEAAAVVIDLRGSGGGNWDTLRAVAGRFIQEGPLFQRVDRQGRMNVHPTTGGYWGRDVPLAVLVDADTSFESETLAAALRDRAGARVIGIKTSGFAGGTQQVQLPEGSTLFVQNSLIRTSQGAPISGAGVEPDEQVEISFAQGKDSQLEASQAYLKSKLGR